MLAGDLGPVAAAAIGEGEAGLARFGLTCSALSSRCSPRRPRISTSPRAPGARRGRVEARRRATAGAPARERGARVHPEPRRYHRSRARGRRGRSGAPGARRSSSTARRSRWRTAGVRTVPGDDEPVREQARRRGARKRAPLSPFFFDCLHLDGQDLLDRPARERLAVLESVGPGANRVPRSRPAIRPRLERSSRKRSRAVTRG